MSHRCPLPEVLREILPLANLRGPTVLPSRGLFCAPSLSPSFDLRVTVGTGIKEPESSQPFNARNPLNQPAVFAWALAFPP